MNGSIIPKSAPGGSSYPNADGHRLASKRVFDIMSPVVMTIDGDMPAGEAIQIIADRSLRHLPLVEGPP